MNFNQRQNVGELNIEAIKRLTGIELPSAQVWMYPGLVKHVKKRHPGIMEQYGHFISEIISNPDYVGKNPSEPGSIELIKYVSPYLLLAVKLDPSGYVFISSFYELNNGPVKVQKRLANGRLKPFSI
jgi:hypothetical protein